MTPIAMPSPEILPAAGAQDAKVEVVAHEPLARAMALPCTLTLEVPVTQFSVGSLMRLAVGSIVETATQQNEDLPLTVNGQLVGLVEIEVVADRLAIRLAAVA